MDDEISPTAVRDLLDGEDPPCVVDIRSRPAFDRGHIPGSRNIPFAELVGRVEELEGEGHVVTVCPHGKSSIQAARLIKSYAGTADARVESMHGGLEAWPGRLVRDDDVAAESAAATDADEDAPF